MALWRFMSSGMISVYKVLCELLPYTMLFLLFPFRKILSSLLFGINFSYYASAFSISPLFIIISAVDFVLGPTLSWS